MQHNNFNFLRLLFAMAVVVTHAFPLSGTKGGDYLAKLTYGQVQFSTIGLAGFFIISGYCVYQSLIRSTTLTAYYWKRVLRIFPALFVVLFLSVLLGPFVYDGDLKSYLTNESAWTYLPANMTLFHPQGMIDGVFTNSPYNPTINGSLWSLLYEFAFYIFLSGLFFIQKPHRLWLIIFLLIVLLVAGFGFSRELGDIAFILEGDLVLEFLPFFFFGTLLAMVPIERIPYKRIIIASLLLILVAGTLAGHYGYVRYFTLPALVILVGLSSSKYLKALTDKLGDISYGIYIYSFPIQQTLMYYFDFTPLQLMISSLLLSGVAGYLSWHLIEKNFLKYKEFIGASRKKSVG